MNNNIERAIADLKEELKQCTVEIHVGNEYVTTVRIVTDRMMSIIRDKMYQLPIIK